MWREHLECSKPVLQLFMDPLNKWDPDTLWKVMTCCVIMYNMIMDDGEGDARGLKFDHMGDLILLPNQNPAAFDEFVQMCQ